MHAAHGMTHRSPSRDALWRCCRSEPRARAPGRPPSSASDVTNPNPARRQPALLRHLCPHAGLLCPDGRPAPVPHMAGVRAQRLATGRAE
eukprot:7239106-Prymnesium_polylepis.2